MCNKQNFAKKKYFKQRLLSILFSSFFVSINAQQVILSDTITSTLNPKNWIFDFQLDQRTSFIEAEQYSGAPIRVNGFTLGWTHKRRYRIGVGAYFIRNLGSKAYFLKYSPLLEKATPNAKIIGTGNNKFYLVQNKVQLFYITPSFEYIFYRSKWIDLSIPLELGIGYSKFILTEYFSGETLPIINKKGNTVKAQNVFFPALAGFAIKLNLSPDVALNASIGYRKILTEIGLNQDFDGLYYQIGLQLIPTNIKNNIKRDFKAWKAKRKN
jgi:hypothetical protein